METEPIWQASPGHLQISRAEVHLWRIPLSLPDARQRRLTTVLADDEAARAERFYFERDRRRFIAGRGALRTILAAYLACDPAEVVFNYGERGKPELAAPAEPRLHFNLSHAHDLALLAVACGRLVGVDLEYIRPMPDATSIAQRFFSSQECERLATVAPEEVVKAFFSCWTRKEAYIKATGDGLSRPLDSFDVTFLPGELPTLTVVADPAETARWSLHALQPAPRYVGALVVEGHGWQPSYWQY